MSVLGGSFSSDAQQVFPQQQQQHGSTVHPKVKVVAGYALQQRLGAGSFATVYKGVRVRQQSDSVASSTVLFDGRGDTNSGNSNSGSGEGNGGGSNHDTEPDTVAVKAIARTSKLTKKVLQNLEIEISILQTYRHPNIVCMHNVQKTENHFYLLLEFCGGGDVQNLIRTRKTGRLTERLTRRIMRDLAAGLRFLWGQELIHRDIKPQNLLLTGPLPLDEAHDPENTPRGEEKRREANFPSERFALKIADFGFARHLQTTSLAETLCGSPLYMAPEILQHQRYDAKADLWSVGTVLFEMVAGRPPFNGENHIDLLRNIQRKAVRLPPDVRVSKACVNLLRLLLNRNPLSRAGFKEFFEACDAFVALGCKGVATQDSGTCRMPGNDLGTIQEIEDAESLPQTQQIDGMTPASNNHPVSQPTTLLPQNSPIDSTPPQVLGRTAAPTSIRQYANRLSPLVSSPPNFDSVTLAPRVSAYTPSTQPWQQPFNNAMELAPTGRKQTQQESQSSSQTSNDDSGFVMVEYGTNSSTDPFAVSGSSTAVVPTNMNPNQQMQQQQQEQQQQHQYQYQYHHQQQQEQQQFQQPSSFNNAPAPSPHPSPLYYTPSTPPIASNRVDYMVVKPPKGMLSTSPGTGGLLMGFGVARSRRLSHETSPGGQTKPIDSQVASVKKLIATAEDVGRRAVSVAHLGDTRAYLAMKMAYSSNDGSSVMSSSPMEGIIEETGAPREGTGANTVGFRSSELVRRRSSVSSDKQMTDKSKYEEDDDVEEMPFASSPQAEPVELPSRESVSMYHTKTLASSSGTSGSNKPAAKSCPQLIRATFGEALSCYLRALKMLKGSVSAAQRVMKELEVLSLELAAMKGTPRFNVANIQNRAQVTSSWLSTQFRGVLERADATNAEISKLPSIPSQSMPVHGVEELIYNHALASGRDGAVKQLLGQYEAARSCYRSAGLLAETLLMEMSVSEDDRKVLESYVDGFAARITELDELLRNSASASASISSSRRSGVIGLIGPPPSAPTTLTDVR